MSVKYRLVKKRNLGTDQGSVPEKLYAQPVYGDLVSFDEILKEIAEAGIPTNGFSYVDNGDEAVIADIVERYTAAFDDFSQKACTRRAKDNLLCAMLLLKLGDVDGVRILGPRENRDRIGTVAFDVDGVHPHDVGQFIDAQGIAIRVGHHCAQPVHRHFGVYASNRASSGVYNSVADAQALVEAVSKVRAFFRV